MASQRERTAHDPFAPFASVHRRVGVRIAAMGGGLVFAGTLGILEPSVGAANATWVTRVTVAGPVWQYPEPVTGIGIAGTNRLWVFLSSKAVARPDALWEVDIKRHALLVRVRWPGPVSAYGTASDGAAYVVWGRTLEEWWGGRATKYTVPTGVSVVAVAPVSHTAVWLAWRMGTTGRVEVGLYRLPDEVVEFAHHVAGMANENVGAMAAAPGGCWVTSAPRPLLYWVPEKGGPSTYTRLYATPFALRDARQLGGVGVDASGQGWVSGYTTAGHPAVWWIAGSGRLPLEPPRLLPPVVNMVSIGLAVAPTGIGYVGFSAIGGSSGFPGVAGVAPKGGMSAVDWPNLAIPGGGIGAEVLAPTGILWATMPFSRLVLPLQAESR